MPCSKAACATTFPSSAGPTSPVAIQNDPGKAVDGGRSWAVTGEAAHARRAANSSALRKRAPRVMSWTNITVIPPDREPRAKCALTNDFEPERSNPHAAAKDAQEYERREPHEDVEAAQLRGADRSGQQRHRLIEEQPAQRSVRRHPGPDRRRQHEQRVGESLAREQQEFEVDRLAAERHPVPSHDLPGSAVPARELPDVLTDASRVLGVNDRVGLVADAAQTLARDLNVQVHVLDQRAAVPVEGADD